jgi:hypothetical protein
MSNCIKEATTQHYLGLWGGFGPVSNAEDVVIAVFRDHAHAGNTFGTEVFERKQLKRNNLSLGRNKCTTKRTFVSRVVTPGESQKGPLVGIRKASVSRLRQMRADIVTRAGTTTVRSICILDSVQRPDFCGHATAGYCEDIAAVVDKEDSGLSHRQRDNLLKTIREKIELDLQQEFSDIGTLDAGSWAPTAFIVMKYHLNSVCRGLKARFNT